MDLLRLLLIITTLLFILLQRIDVRVTKDEKLTVKISFIFFALLLIEEKDRKRRLWRFSKIRKRLKALFKSSKYLISRSDIILHRHYGKDDTQNYSKPIIDVSFHFSLFNLIISASILLYYIIKNEVKRVI